MILLALLSSSLAFSLQPLHQAHAAGDLSIPEGISLVDPGATITIDVSVNGMDIFNGWDIAIWSNTTALSGISIDLSTDTAFAPGTSFYQAEACVNDKGSNCNNDTSTGGIDAMGIVHSQVVVLAAPTSSVTGVLFSINYKAGAYTYSTLQFKLSRIINGGCTPCPDVDHTTEDGSYGTTSAPNVSFTISDQFPSVTQGQMVNTTATVTSINDFSGQVNFAYQPNSIAKGIQVTFNTTSVFLNNSTASVNITISTSPTTSARGYSLNITATGPRVFQDRLIGLSVQEPGDFTVAINPALVAIPQNSTTSATVTIYSQTRHDVSQEFSGNVTLTAAARNATAMLGQTLFFVGPGRTVSTTLTIWVPPSFYGFTYLINVTGVWVNNRNLNYTAQVVVTHLPSDIIPTVSPNTLTVVAGHSVYGVLSVTSANYFVGYVYPASTMSGGTARFNETTLRLDIGRTVSVSVNVTIDPSIAPGHYVVLLTATGQLASGTAFARSIAENIIVQSNGHLVVQLPTKILGLPVLAYWGFLGGFAAIFILLSALLLRRNRADRDEWD